MLLSTVLIASLVVGAPESPLHFQIPADWVDLSPGVFAQNASRISRPGVEHVQKLFREHPDYVLFAAQIDAQGRIQTAMRVKMADCPPAIDQEALNVRVQLTA